MVGVLVLVDQDVAEASAVVLGDVREPDHQGDRVTDDVVEVDGLGPRQALLVGRVDVGEGLLGLVGGPGAERLRVHQLVLEPGDAVEQPTGRHPLRVEVEIAGDEGDQAQAVGLVVDREGRLQPQPVGLPTQDPHARGVERRDPHRPRPRTDRGLDPLAHLGGGLVREGDGQDLARTRVAGGQQVGDPPGQDPGLARASTGHDEQRAATVLHGRALRRVEPCHQFDDLGGPVRLGEGPAIGLLRLGPALRCVRCGNGSAHHVSGAAGLWGARSDAGRHRLRRGWGSEQRRLIGGAVSLLVDVGGGHGRPREAGQHVVREHPRILGARADTARPPCPADYLNRTFLRFAQVHPASLDTDTDIQ